MHAFYSKKQENSTRDIEMDDNKRNVRHNVYLTDAGEELIVTEVSESSDRINSHGKNFSDSKYLGIVSKWKSVVYWQ